jgi:hypothetical protein
VVPVSFAVSSVTGRRSRTGDSSAVAVRGPGGPPRCSWAAEIDLEPYVDGLAVATMAERWQDSRRLKQMLTVAHEVLVAEQELRAAAEQQPAGVEPG